MGLQSRKANVESWVYHGAIAQLGERCFCKAEVRGSIPLGSTSFLFGIRQPEDSKSLLDAQSLSIAGD